MKNSSVTIPFILLIIILLGIITYAFLSNYKIVKISSSNSIEDSGRSQLDSLNTINEGVHTYLTGRQYCVNTDQFTDFRYTKAYSNSTNEFITTYILYRSDDNTPSTKITATHYKTENKIVVKVSGIGSGVLDTMTIHQEEVTCDTPSLKEFGIEGAAHLLSNRVPFQLDLKFVNDKFERVNIGMILCSEEDGGIFAILDYPN